MLEKIYCVLISSSNNFELFLLWTSGTYYSSLFLVSIFSIPEAHEHKSIKFLQAYQDELGIIAHPRAQLNMI